MLPHQTATAYQFHHFDGENHQYSARPVTVTLIHIQILNCVYISLKILNNKKILRNFRDLLTSDFQPMFFWHEYCIINTRNHLGGNNDC